LGADFELEKWDNFKIKKFYKGDNGEELESWTGCTLAQVEAQAKVGRIYFGWSKWKGI